MDADIELEVFRSGDYGARGSYTAAELDRIAAAYDPARHEAPVTLDHAQAGPAFGWVAGLRRSGETLLARLRDVPESLREALRRGAYRKRSIELYRALAPEGGPYLKAVSFLGAAAPAVKGLADPVFAEGEADVIAFDDAGAAIADSLRDQLRQSGRWLPAWDALGVAGLLAELTGPQRDTLVAAFAAMPAPAPRAPQPHSGDSPLTMFSESLADAAPSAVSLQRHRRAVQWMAANPGSTYRDALLGANAHP